MFVQYYQVHQKINLANNKFDNQSNSLYVIFYFTDLDNCFNLSFDISKIFKTCYIECLNRFNIVLQNSRDYNKIIYHLFMMIKRALNDYTCQLIKMEIKISDKITISTADNIYIGRNNIKTQVMLLNKKINEQLNIYKNNDEKNKYVKGNNNITFRHRENKHKVLDFVKNLFIETEE